MLTWTVVNKCVCGSQYWVGFSLFENPDSAWRHDMTLPGVHLLWTVSGRKWMDRSSQCWNRHFFVGCCFWNFFEDPLERPKDRSNFLVSFSMKFFIYLIFFYKFFFKCLYPVLLPFSGILEFMEKFKYNLPWPLYILGTDESPFIHSQQRFTIPSSDSDKVNPH